MKTNMKKAYKIDHEKIWKYNSILDRLKGSFFMGEPIDLNNVIDLVIGAYELGREEVQEQWAISDAGENW